MKAGRGRDIKVKHGEGVVVSTEIRTQSPAHTKKKVRRRADSQLLRNIIKALHIGSVLYIQFSIQEIPNEATYHWKRRIQDSKGG